MVDSCWGNRGLDHILVLIGMEFNAGWQFPRLSSETRTNYGGRGGAPDLSQMSANGQEAAIT
jgi:hypothetical protein